MVILTNQTWDFLKTFYSKVTATFADHLGLHLILDELLDGFFLTSVSRSSYSSHNLTDS